MSEGDKLFASEDGLPGSSDSVAAVTGGSIDGSSASSSSSQPPMIQSKHMTALFFHVLFKAAAIILYICYDIFFSENFILLFVLCVLLLAFDFWTVKNITGRLLVGLRWWNEVREDGSNVWIYESKPDSREVGSSDRIIFWGAMAAAFAIWSFLFFGVFFTFRFKNLLIIGVALALTGANLWGYWKCSKDAKRDLQGMFFQRLAATAAATST